MKTLTKTEIDNALHDLKGWELEDNKLTKHFKFKNFRDAMAFLMRLSFEAEAVNHHPEIENVYNKVRLSLTTHDAGDKLTEKDVILARRIEKLYLGMDLDRKD